MDRVVAVCLEVLRLCELDENALLAFRALFLDSPFFQRLTCLIVSFDISRFLVPVSDHKLVCKFSLDLV